MNILHLANIAGLKSGGIGEVVHSLTKYQNNHENATLWFPGSKNVENEVIRITGLSEDEIKAMSTIGANKYGFAPKLFCSYKYVEHNFDVLHQHGVFLPLSLFSKNISKKVKVIISPHGLYEPERLQFSRIKKKIIRKLFEDSNLSKASCLSACSEQEAINLRIHGFKNPIAIIPNGIDPEFLTRPKTNQLQNKFRLRNSIQPETKILLFLSRIHPFKGLSLLIDSIYEIKERFISNNWVMIIAGMDELNHTKFLNDKIRFFGLNQLIKIFEPQFGEDKEAILDAANCFILPSLNENFGIVIIEALSRGLPVIATQNTPWKELNTFSCGWWIKRSKEEFINSFVDLFNKSETELIQMGNNGIDLVRKKYLWPEIANQSLEVYNWLLSDFDKNFEIKINLLK